MEIDRPLEENMLQVGQFRDDDGEGVMFVVEKMGREYTFRKINARFVGQICGGRRRTGADPIEIPTRKNSNAAAIE